MNGIEKITARILSDSQGAVEAVKQEAAARCAEIAAAGDAAAQDEYWKLLKKGTEDAEKRGERLESVAQLEAKKQILGAKQQLISEVFELAAEKLIAMPERKAGETPEYIQLGVDFRPPVEMPFILEKIRSFLLDKK